MDRSQGLGGKRARNDGAVGKDKPKRRRAISFIPLEPRIMYDGAAAVTAAAGHHHHHHDGASNDPAQAGGATGGAGAPMPGGGDGHWHATPAEPMPHVVTWVKDPTEIVFIDSQVPDAQLLAKGVNPGVEVVMLDANSDGVQQIADFLSRHPDPNLTTIDIVAHGADGVVQLGTTLLSSSTIGYYQTELAAIGKAMQPGGNIQIYGCDVAADSSGDLFLVQLSQATGGKNVDASSGLVGAAALGGSWTLNVELGGPPTANPFTDATLAAFPDVLPDQIFITTIAGGNDTASDYRVEDVSSTGSASMGLQDTTPKTPLAQPVDIAVDAAHGVYYLIDDNFSGVPGANATQAIEVGKLNGATFGDNKTLDTIFSLPGSTDAFLGLALDPLNNVLYFGQGGSVETGSSTTASAEATYTGIFRLNLSNLNLNNPSLSSPLSETQVVTGTGLSTPRSLALDVTHQIVYFIDDSETAGGLANGFPLNTATNQIYEAKLPVSSTPSNATLIYSLDASRNSNFTGYDQGMLSGIALDQPDGKLFFTTIATTGGGISAVYSAHVNEVGGVPTVPTGGQLLAQTTLFQGSTIGQPSKIGLDVASDTFFTVTDGGSTTDHGEIVQGNMDGSGTPSTLFTSNLADANSKTLALFVDDAPVVTSTGPTPTYDAGGSAVTVDSGITVADSNVIDLASATVSITNNFQSGDVLGIPAGDLTAGKITGTNITESYNSSTGVLTLSGIDTVAHYQLAMQEVTFSSTLASPSASPRTITFSASDGVASGTATDTVDVAVPPTIGGTGNTANFLQSLNAAAPLDTAITVSDPNSANITSATVTVSAGFLSGDTLGIPAADITSGKITGTNISFSVSGNQLTLSGPDTAAHYQTALRDVTYNFTGDPTNAGADKTRTVTWSVTDADSLTSAAGSTTTLDVFTIPVVSLGGTTTVTDTSGGAAVLADSGVTVTDANGINIAGATIAIGGAQTGDALSDNGVSNGGVVLGNIHATFSGGTLTLSGSDTLAHYTTALDEVQFSTTSTNATARTLTWTVDDHAASQANKSTGVTSTVDVIAPPHITGAGTTATFTGGSAAVVLDSGIAVTDAAGTLASATISIVSPITGDTLNFTNNGTSEGNIAVSSNAGGQLVLSSAGGTATLAQWDAALDSITYSFNPANGDPTGGGSHTTRTIDWVVNDGVTNSATAASTLDTVHVAATVTAGASTVFANGGSPVTLDGALTVSDVDSGGNLSSATVTIGSGLLAGDTLNFTNNGTSEGNIAVSSNAGGQLVLTSAGGAATLAQWDAALDSITYSFSGDASNGGADTSRTITYTVNDGTANSAAATSTVTIDTPPTVTAGGIVPYTGGGHAVTLEAGITLSDSFGSLSGATVTIGGFLTGDMFNFTDQNGISGVYSSGTLTLTGTATTAQYRAALASITYSDGNNDPTGGGTFTNRTIQWQVTDTDGLTSAVSNSTLDTAHVAPTVAAGTTATFTGGGSPVALDSTLTVSDVDSGGNLVGAQVQIVGFVNGEVLNFTTQNGISETSYRNGVLTLSGTATVVQYQAALRSVTFSFNPANGDPTLGGTNTQQSIYWVINDGNTVNGTNETFSPTQAINNDQPSLGLNQLVVESGIFPTAGAGGASGITQGSIRTFAGTDSFTDDAAADGQSLSITSNPTLFSILGRSYGGDGVTTFGLPNLGGTLAVGFGGSSNLPLGERFGSDQFTLNTQELPHRVGGGGLPFDNDQPSQTVNYIINVSGAFSGGTNVIGEVIPFLGNFAPAGYVFASGQLLSIAQNPALFSIMGTTYGGDGITTFALPDLNGKTIIGAGSDNFQTVLAGATTGQDATTIATSNLPGPIGLAGPVSNDQPTVALTYLIATQGLFPDSTVLSPEQPYLGEIIAYAGLAGGLDDMLSSGWAIARGQTLAISENLALFDVLGTTYGGNGQTTFNLPDLVGRSIAGVGTNADGQSVQLGETFGTNSFTLQSNNLPLPTVATSTLDLVHAPPSVTAATTATFDGGGSPVAIDPTLAVSVPDSGDQLTGATVKISGGLNAGDTLNFTTQNGISEVSYSNGVLTLTGNATGEQYQSALESVTYSFNPADGDPTIGNTDTTRTISYTVNDGVAISTAATSTLDTVHVAPTVVAGDSVTYLVGGSPVALDSGLTVTDPDSGDQLTGATVKIDNGFLAGDSLNFTNTANITEASYINGTLTLTGTATVEQYQAALDSITFSSINLVSTSHTIDWTVKDSVSSSTLETSTVAVQIGPILTAGPTLTGTEGASTGTVTVASFTDPTLAGATASDFTATVDWGDGSAASIGTVSALGGGVFAVTGSHIYAEEGAYPIGVAVTDTDSITGNASDSASIADAPLTAGGAVLPGGVEGVTAATLGAMFTDGNPNAPTSDFSGTVTWGDGASTNFTGSNVTAFGNGLFAVSGLSHLYAEDGTKNFSVFIKDAGGSTTTDIGITTVADAPLTAGTATATGGVEGTTAATLSATFSDANTAAPTSDFSGTIAWGDGTTSTFTSADVTGSNGNFTVSGSHVYAEEGTFAPVVTINDVGGSTTTDTGTATVADAPLTAGTATATGGVEGVTAATLSATFGDANTGALAGDFSGTIAWGDNTTSNFTSADVAGSNGNFTVTGSHLYAEDGTYTPVVTIHDDGGSTTTDTGTTTVADAPLTAGTVTWQSARVEGEPAGLNATFTDANTRAPASDFSGTITWGDGTSSNFTSADVLGANGFYLVTVSHVYADEGSSFPIVTIEDVGGSSTVDVGPFLTVADAPLTAGTATVTGGVEGTTAATLSATFSDANTGALASDFSGTIAWGDNTTSTFTSADVTGSNGNFTVTGSHLYAEDGTYTPVVTINDVGGSTTTDTGTTTVADAPLTAGTATASGGVEGVTAATLSATFTDANTAAPISDFSGTIAWGDNTTSNFTSADVAGSNGNFTVTGSHLYAEDGTYMPVVTIHDVGGSTTTDTGTTTVADAPLTAGTATASGGVEGVTAATLSATFSDANTAATASDFSGTITWGDSTTSTFTSADVTGSNGNFIVSGSHLYAEDGTFAATVAIIDDGGSTATETGTTTVADAPLTAGTATATGGVEGTTAATLSATFSDANTGALTSDFSGTIAWGDGTSTNFTSADVAGSNGNFTVSGSHLYAEEGTFAPVVTINDVGGSTTTDTGTATVADAPLTPGSATASGGVEGVTAATLSATFTDANTAAPTSDFAGTVAWGDGVTTNFTSADVAGSNGNFTVSGSHLYAEEGTYKPLVTIIDDGGSTTTETGTTTVLDAPLTAAATALNGTQNAALAATVATFTDANPNAPLSDFTTTINWGDGTTSNGTVTENVGVFSVAGTHTYAVSGVYNANVLIADVGGSTATVTDTVDVVPGAPPITALVGEPVNGGTVELKGTGEAGDIVNLYADGNTATPVGTGTVTPGGTFDIITTADFTDGVHSFTATETDAAHLTSVASTPAFAVDVAPTLSAGGTVTYVQDGSAIPLDATATADPGDPGGPLTGATVSIGAGFFPGDVLDFTNQNGITGNYDAAHGVLTLTGSASIANYNAALDSISFLSTSPNPSNDGADPTRTISWSVTDANPTNAVSATVTSTVDVHAVPTVVAGADVSFQAGLGQSVVLDLPIGAFDGTNLTGATVTIADGFQSGEVLRANTAGTNIAANYSNGVLTLSGTDTPHDYQQVLSSVAMSGTAVQTGPTTINWQITDQNHLTSKVATSTVEVAADPAPPHLSNPVPQIPANFDHGHFGDFSGMVTNANAPGTAGLSFGAGHALYVIHSDINPTVADNGTIGFDLALNQLEAALGGDVVSVTATLADGKPLPAWLQFNNDTGQFAGLVPDDITGSIDHDGDGGFDSGQGGSQLMTVQVIARDSKGNLAVTDFTIDFATPTQHKADKHGWNVQPGEKFIDPWGQVRQRRDFASHSGLGPHRDVAAPDALDHVAWHAPAFDADRVHADSGLDHAPAGRTGFSDQIKSHGWHAVAAQRTALLDSLRQGVAGWR